MLGASRLVLHSDVVHYSRKGKTCVSVKIYIYIYSFFVAASHSLGRNAFSTISAKLVHGWYTAGWFCKTQGVER